MNLFKGILFVITLGVFVFLLGCATVEKGGGEPVRLKEPRIKPLAKSEWTAEQLRILEPWKNPDGSVINVFTTMANHPKFTEAWNPFGLYILRGQTLPPRDREILILRIGWLCRAEYEFGRHRIVGKRVGLTDEEIDRIPNGPKAPGWNAFDATLLRATDELYHDSFITDATWNALAKRYNEKQLVDLVGTVGQYSLVSMMLNTFGVQLEPGVPGFPKGKNK
jgi:4-carboxymuconolactone decarboxylase